MGSPCYFCVCESRLIDIRMPELYETGYVYHSTWSHLNGVPHKSLTSVCVCIFPIVARHRPSKNVTAATNIHAKMEQFLGASFYIRSVSCQREAGDQFFSELPVWSSGSIGLIVLLCEVGYVVSSCSMITWVRVKNIERSGHSWPLFESGTFWIRNRSANISTTIFVMFTSACRCVVMGL
jgi:hypothetical protein